MILDAVRTFLEEHGIGPCGIVAAVSGGVDSTALLLTLVHLRADGYTITCGHVNHHLRGAESDDDQEYVAGLCQSLEIPLDVADGTIPPALLHEMGIEAAAREVRTNGLRLIRERSGARLVATAHQKNDQAETIVMRLFTGSGLAGMRGIHPVREDGFIRPFLGITRSEIEDFLHERGITPRVDRMNSDRRFLRTRVREMLAGFEPAVVDHLAAVAPQARSQWAISEALLDAIEDAEIAADQTRFRSLPDAIDVRSALLHRHIRRLGGGRNVSAADLARLARGLDRLTRTSVTKSLELIRRDDALILRRTREPIAPYEVELRAGEEVSVPATNYQLHIRRCTTSEESRFRSGPRNACILPASPPASIRHYSQSTNDLTAPTHTNFASNKALMQPFQLPAGGDPNFVIRNRRNGDRFHPLGLGAEKKLKELLIDRKVPVEDRDAIPLLVWNGEIVWVAGVEVSDRFKVATTAGDRYVAEIRPAHSVSTGTIVCNNGK